MSCVCLPHALPLPPGLCACRVDVGEPSLPDWGSFVAGDLGNDETAPRRYLDTRSTNVRNIMDAVSMNLIKASLQLQQPRQLVQGLCEMCVFVVCKGGSMLSRQQVSPHHPCCCHAVQRVSLCASKGFQVMSAYGTDSYTATTGFPLTLADAKSFALFLASKATAAGLGVGLLQTNGLLSDPAVVSAFDFAVSGPV